MNYFPIIMNSPQRFKVVLIGDAGVGKSTFIHRHLTGDFKTKYVATLGVDVHSLLFNTNYGPIVLDIWDTAGQERFRNQMNGYAAGAKALIGFFDVTSKITLEYLMLNSLDSWLQKHPEYAHLLDSVPSVVCGNKCDISKHKVKTTDKKALLDTWNKYYDVSAKSNYNFDKPFLYLSRVLTGHDDLEFVDKEGVFPIEIMSSNSLSVDTETDTLIVCGQEVIVEYDKNSILQISIKYPLVTVYLSNTYGLFMDNFTITSERGDVYIAPEVKSAVKAFADTKGLEPLLWSPHKMCLSIK